ncbi:MULTISPECIES: amino acid ABC transporter substrate-binding protein [unclassified Undibacterium]|uniref:amino acid ABC transporter substrate-binding protein n=1 Tax=unclassified Undibacterium TaxID=2630295 RepID=UPI002AC99884|nr:MULTISPECIES: amino acid ABC transporter substrate-binding protein [unclassified Undibacterium]MEB0138271.1 amino acid ABC transporter substrate-binding protein [Undibacterium sp. CCC2.1]MEB0171568.1 amino acid ABC transporter substrate-binding protein [Undibacterium sp. CCC1.1]MEB0175512.1 amino acid ABC transporter substrate-binding protein [Undibacterium sp. CCC3.4]MEB0214768.1 amino acid ABC transporter substrate-binding protein [Undibacterium sp. 5I2]WPX45255.1 amino acid ABC transport
MRMLDKCWAAGLLYLLVAALPLTAAADTLAHIKETQTVTIAYRESSVPFSYLTTGKVPMGYSIDVCLKFVDAIKKELKSPGLKVNYVSVTPSTRIAMIAEGHADMECGSTTNNAERRKQVSFIIPHFFAATRMIVRSDAGIKNWTDLKDKKVVTTKGTTTVKLLNDRDKARGLNLRLLEGNDHAESFGMVEKFSADAFTMDDVLLYGFRANSSHPDKFVIVGDALSTEPYGIVVHKEDAAFKDLLDREMARMMNDGELTRLYDKWFKKAIPPNGVNLAMPMGFLLRDNIRFPSDKVAD